MVAKFETRAEAVKVVGKLDSGIYELRYGEYERPTYKVRKIRGEDAYGIRATYFFYPNTFNAKKDGFLTVEELYYSNLAPKEYYK